MGAETLTLIAALLGTSVLGSWHCAGMCGAIAVNMRGRGDLVAYHAGRGAAYITLGFLAGAVGERALTQSSPSLRIAAAVVLGLMLILHEPPPFFHRWLQRGSLGAWRAMFRLRTPPLLVGLLSGFLPCAWLWTFLAAAASTGRPSSGALVLAALWVGSLPALIGMGLYFRRGIGAAQGPLARWAPRIVMLAGLVSLIGHFMP